jgi:hypothetical protein
MQQNQRDRKFHKEEKLIKAAHKKRLRNSKSAIDQTVPHLRSHSADQAVRGGDQRQWPRRASREIFAAALDAATPPRALVIRVAAGAALVG